MRDTQVNDLRHAWSVSQFETLFGWLLEEQGTPIQQLLPNIAHMFNLFVGFSTGQRKKKPSVSGRVCLEDTIFRVVLKGSKQANNIISWVPLCLESF